VFAGSPSPFADTTGHETLDNQSVSNLATAAADRQGLEFQKPEQAQTALPHIYNRRIAIPAPPAPLAPPAPPALTAPPATYVYPAPSPPNQNQISRAPD
jgi:hypothetical protein